MGYYEKTNFGFAFTTKTGTTIEFDDRHGDLTIRFGSGRQETTRLTPYRDVLQNLYQNETKSIKETLWINTDYVPLGCGWFMKQDEYKKKIKDKGYKIPVLSLIHRTYASR